MSHLKFIMDNGTRRDMTGRNENFKTEIMIIIKIIILSIISHIKINLKSNNEFYLFN